MRVGGLQLEVLWLKPCVLRDARQHSRTDFFAVVKGENEIVKPWPGKHTMRACLALQGPAQAV